MSQAVTRRLLRRNFYDALLEQDGHDLERFSPPRDLRAWHSQPVSALANRRPIVLESLDAISLRNLLTRHAYQAFPVVTGGQIVGVLHRDEAEASLELGRVPSLGPAAVCLEGDSLKQAERRLIEEGATMAVILSADKTHVTGILTLHDLLRAQLAASERGEDSS